MDIRLRDTAVRAEVAALSAERADLWSDVVGIAHVEEQIASLEDRLLHAKRTGAPLTVHGADDKRVTGVCIEVGDDVIVIVDETDSVALALAHVTRIDGLVPALRDGSEPEFTWLRVVRGITTPCRISLIDGSLLAGRIDVVGRDYLTLEGSAASVIALAAIVRIRWAT